MRRVEVVPHNPRWKNDFEMESERIAIALGENLITLHHIGSTAISTIHAKPIIDILAVVKDIEKVGAQNINMEALGYEAMGEFGITDRRFFRKNNDLGIRTHHVHIFETNSPQIERHLAFRDYMIAHPETAQQYSDLKRELAKQYPDDIERYMDGKDDFIKEIDQEAAKWR